MNHGLNAQDKLASYTDPRAIVTSYVRNGFGEVIQETSPDSGVTIYVRNALGDVTQMTDARGVVTNYSYDAAGRMLTKSYPAAPEENVSYSYDATANGNKGIGRLTGSTSQSGSTAWVYDERGNIVAETPGTSDRLFGYPAIVPFRGGPSRSGFKPERMPPESLTPSRFRICSVG